MLPVASAALPRDRAWRLNPAWGGPKDSDHTSPVKAFALLGDLHSHAFPRQPACDEDHFAISPANDHTAVGNPFEFNLLHRTCCLVSRCHELLSWYGTEITITPLM